MEQIQEAIAVQGDDSPIIHVTAVLGIKHGRRDLPVTWEETLSPPGARTEASLQQYDQLVGVI